MEKRANRVFGVACPPDCNERVGSDLVPNVTSELNSSMADLPFPSSAGAT